jgi:methionine-rich copper-binding protein CopC
MVLTLPALAPGHYQVSWHAVSVDTHRTEGTFSFDIQP